MHDGKVPDTITNLLEAAAGENSEWTSMYKRMAEEAREEGYTAIAAQMEGVAKIEKHHEDRYRKLVANIKSDSVFAKQGEKVWMCRNCGHLHVGKKAPEVCPVCVHPKAYFEVQNVSYGD